MRSTREHPPPYITPMETRDYFRSLCIILYLCPYRDQLMSHLTYKVKGLLCADKVSNVRSRVYLKYLQF